MNDNYGYHDQGEDGGGLVDEQINDDGVATSSPASRGTIRAAAAARNYDSEDVQQQHEENGEEDDGDLDDEDSESDNNSSDDDSSYAEKERVFSATASSLHHLLQYRRIELAYERLQLLKQQDQNGDDGTTSTLLEEIFDLGEYDEYPIHVCLRTSMQLRTSSERECTYKFITEIIHRVQEYSRVDAWDMLLGTFPVHKVIGGGHDYRTLTAIIKACPEALVQKGDDYYTSDKTPLEYLDRLFKLSQRISIQPITPEQNSLARDYIQRNATSWTQHRLRLSLYQIVKYYFLGDNNSISSSSSCSRRNYQKCTTTTSTTDKTNARSLVLTPFNEQDRELYNISPQPWFAISVLGDLLQREMKPLMQHILSFVGYDAKVEYDNDSKYSTRKKHSSMAEEDSSTMETKQKKQKKEKHEESSSDDE